VSDPIQLDDGWHIIKVLDVKEPYTPTLDEIRTQLIQQMRNAKARDNSQQYLEKLVKEHPVQIDELNLSKVLK
jgi:peptidylprolyl isomerase